MCVVAAFDAPDWAAGILFLCSFWALRLIMGVVFTGQVGRHRQMDTTTKIFWTIGLLIVFTIFVIPYYWYRFYAEPYRTSRMLRLE